MISVISRQFIGASIRKVADVLTYVASQFDPPEIVDETPLPQNPITEEAAAMLAKPIWFEAPKVETPKPLAGSVAARMARGRQF